MAINFGDLISIDKNWVDKELTHHYDEYINDKLKVRLYTISPSGTTIDSISLANALLDLLPDYFKTKSEINKQVQRKVDETIQEGTTACDIDLREQAIKLISNRNYRKAAKFFKKKTCDSKSGKYGELLLFGLVESIFNCKMIAHKITNITNYHDEIKGGDGIFLGDYTLKNGTKNPAYLIGESKVWKDYTGAKKDALDSINRFYDTDFQANFKSLELFIAEKDIDKFCGENDIDELYGRLNPSSSLFKSQIAVHPILIMFETKSYDNLMIKASNNSDLIDLINKDIIKKIDKTLTSISKKVKQYPELEKVFLDFILVPTNSIENFNNTMDSLI
ncbi:Hachiman antiphage defense system protein HamA [Flavobacterium sp. LB3P122]|uniref:Hachiman antiphage defense system protein HamA n=1 Tax=Flavobacterium algoriphilum TaxID=3398738 RepID=UPI003A8824E4